MQTNRTPTPYIDTRLDVAISAALDLVEWAQTCPYGPDVMDVLDDLRQSLASTLGDVSLLTVALRREMAVVNSDRLLDDETRILKHCEYCEEPGAREHDELGHVCDACLARFESGEWTSEPDLDLERDRRLDFGWDDYEAGDIPEDDETVYLFIDRQR